MWHDRGCRRADFKLTRLFFQLEVAHGVTLAANQTVQRHRDHMGTAYAAAAARYQSRATACLCRARFKGRHSLLRASPNKARPLLKIPGRKLTCLPSPVDASWLRASCSTLWRGGGVREVSIRGHMHLRPWRLYAFQTFFPLVRPPLRPAASHATSCHWEPPQGPHPRHGLRLGAEVRGK